MMKSFAMMFGAQEGGTPINSPEYSNTFRPAVVLGRCVRKRASVELSSGNTLYFFASA